MLVFQPTVTVQSNSSADAPTATQLGTNVKFALPAAAWPVPSMESPKSTETGLGVGSAATGYAAGEPVGAVLLI